jgi:hypothetical protein
MKRQYVLLILASSLASTVYSAEGPAADSFYVFSKGPETVEITIRRSPFVPEHHKITKVAGETYVDGQKALGIDGTGTINDEITKFEIKWNGKKVPLPTAAYSPIFNFSLQRASGFPSELGELLAVKSSVGKAILFVFGSGTGNVRQWIWLVVTAEGQWYRFEGSDGDAPL